MRVPSFCLFLFFFTFHFLLFTFRLSVAAEAPSKITADYMEHFAAEDKYVATGNVVFEKDKTVVRADRAVFFEKAAHLEAEGHVIYEDQATLINAERAELNVDTKTGKMYNALILLKDQKGLERKEVKKVDFWINSDKVQKIDDSHYYASTATFTACETIAETEGRYRDPREMKAFGSDNPDWCFKGSNVDILIGDRIAGDNMIYRIKGLPVAYFPFFRVPEGADRETGFLSPVLGHTTVKGFEVSPAFFWAIDENKDATFSLDYFTKRGLGEGIEYRYLDINDKGKWFVYHLYDTEEKKTDYVVRGTHNQDFGDIKVFADINYVNQWDYYNQFGHTIDERIERYTQSSAEISAPFTDSRLYMLGQYWVDLQIPPALQTPPIPPQPVSQRLPELGYVVHPTNLGPFLFTMNSSIADFVTNEGGVGGQRLDIDPKLWYTLGDSVRLFQSFGLRETAYNLSDIGTIYSSNPHRESYEYDAVVFTRFIKQYESGTHTIEPSLSFSYSPGYSHPLPLFDSVDVNNNIYYSQPLGTYALLNKTSVAKFSVLSNLSLKGLSFATQVVQPYEFSPVPLTHPLQPTTLSLWLNSGPVGFTTSAAEDFSMMREQSSLSTLSLKVAEGSTVSLSRYFALTSPVTNQYSTSYTAILSKSWTIIGSVLYNQAIHELQTFALHTIYTSKCWGLDVLFQRTPPDTIHPQEVSVQFVVQLKGLGGLKLGGLSSPVQ